MSWVYFYPGMVPQDSTTASPPGCGCEQAFYNPLSGGLQLDGNVDVDGGVNYTNSSQFASCPKFSVADKNNHGLRYPDEIALYEAVTAKAAANSCRSGNQ